MKDHSASLGVMCGQHFGSPSHSRLSRLGLLAQMSSHSNFSGWWVGTDPKQRPKILSPLGKEPTSHHIA
jgi:hypothetical protein